uniref:Uncharacterized protein n=1 Tax=Anguilla anguilla TaxID=7936 RepID=A0A0E9XQ05_ANGAN
MGPAGIIATLILLNVLQLQFLTLCVQHCPIKSPFKLCRRAGLS